MSEPPSRPSSSSRPSSALRSEDSQGRQSPWRHHQRSISTTRIVKETTNARAEYTNNEEDGASQRQINQYLIKEEIGRGSFGAVHLAVDQYGEEYAVKEFSKSRLRKRAMSELLRRKRAQGSGHEGFPRMQVPRTKSKGGNLSATQASFDLIKEEIAIMKKLNHVNLVSLIEVLDDPGEDSIYMVLEYCKRGVIMKVDLEEEAEPYSSDSCRTWFRDLILGVEYLHAQGVIHRDIKPDNLLLTSDDTLKIVDFGVSEMFDKSDPSGREMRIAKSAGSPAFMAPELVSSNHADVKGEPADIWGMGVTLYCLRYGSVPFRQTNIVDLYNSIANDPITFSDEQDPDFVDLMNRLLDKNPATRITMPILREHPWVTRSGDDPLMPASENCAEIVAVPTEDELNDAITGSLGRTMAVLKAVNKFKFLIARKKPYLIDSLFGPGSQMSRDVSEMLDNRKAAGRLLMGIFKSPQTSASDSEKGEQGEGSTKSRVQSPDSMTSGEGEHRGSFSHSHPRRKESGRGQAQDPTETHLFFDIGTGPISTVSEDEETLPVRGRHEGEDNEGTRYIISESPPSAGYNIYHSAYNGEVRRIRRTKGRDTLLFLNRRVEGSGEISHAPVSDLSEVGKQNQKGKGKLAELLGKAAGLKPQKTDEAIEHEEHEDDDLVEGEGHWAGEDDATSEHDYGYHGD